MATFLRAPALGRRLVVVGGMLAALGPASEAPAQVSPNGQQFQVNTYTTGRQEYPAVTADGQGDIVLLWQYKGGWPDYATAVLGQRYEGSGLPLGVEFSLKSYDGSEPAVSAAPGGSFCAVWTSLLAGADGFWGIEARLYDAAGAPLGPEFSVNTYTTGAQKRPAVAAGPQGAFVIVWQSNGSSGTDTDGYSIQARRYDADGNPLGAQFQVNGLTTGDQLSPAVASVAADGFVVVWDMGPGRIDARRFDAAGVPLGGEFQVNTYTSLFQESSAVASDSQGNFVVAWEGYRSEGTDQSGSSIQARRFSATGSPMGAQFQVNSYTTSDQTIPAVAMDATGNFVVAWQSNGSSGTDTSNTSIQARRYTAGGVPASDEFQVNTVTSFGQWNPGVAADRLGNFLVTWGSAVSAGTDHDLTSIQARRYDALFRDGFEAGDTSRWTLAIP